MNIIYTFNDKFVPQIAASICSVCEHNQSENITFYLVIDNVSKKNQNQLKKFITNCNQKSVIIEIGDIKRYFKFDFDTTGWNSIVLARLVLDKIIPNEVDRVLYLDGDTIVRDSLAELYNIDMGKSVIGASIEPTADHKRKQTLGINGAYYNAGVLLIDLEKWRKTKTGQRILDYYAVHDGKLFANDQDAINGALKGEIYSLPPKYNFCNIYTQYPYHFLCKLILPSTYLSQPEYVDSIKHPVVIHYLGEERPWRAGNRHKYRGDYKEYLAKTPWKDTPDERGWQIYYICWNIFNVITKPFPALRYKIITSLIPFVINLRARSGSRKEIKDVKSSKATEDSSKLPKVSILIPAYNAEKLVHKSIDSALSQTHSNLEVVIVDDGSTDGTKQILQKYQQKHPRVVKVFSQKNQGLGATRNALLRKASGDYIINLDADDWLKPDYIETMLSVIGDGDIAICGFERYDAEYQFRDKRIPEPGPYAKYRFCTTAGKIFRRTFLCQNHIRYETVNMGEDAVFNVTAYSKTNMISVVPYSGYCCYESAHSMAHSAKYTEAKSFYVLMKNLVKQLASSSITHDPDFQFYVLKNLLMDVFLYKNDLSTKHLTKIYRQSISWYKKFLTRNDAKFHLRFQNGETFRINLVVNGFIILTKLHLDGITLKILKKIPLNIL